MRSSGRIGPGASTILMILVVLVMTMLGVLSLFSARSDMEMSERTAVAAEEYYAAQTDFSLWLQETLTSLACGWGRRSPIAPPWGKRASSARKWSFCL